MTHPEVECVDCGAVHTGPADVKPEDKFICVSCARARMERETVDLDEYGPHGYHKMTVHSEGGTETVYVPVMDEYAEATEGESDLASDAVRDIGEILEVDLDEYGDLLQEVVEDVILAVRETVLHVAKMTVSPEDYEKLAKIIREGSTE
jgi:hypothetical protein